MLWTLARDRPPLDVKTAASGNDVFRLASGERSHVHRGEGRLEAGIRLAAKLSRKLLDPSNESRGAVDRGGPGVGIGAVTLLAPDFDLRQAVTLVRPNRSKRSGFADDRVPRSHRLRVDELFRANAPQLLVGGEDQGEGF